MESTDKTPEERERELIGQRRTVTGDVDPQRRPWALALSGGGIRSATFCLGLVRSLAKNDLFTRFDYLSTVSGGGYVGSAIGRLFSPLANAQRVNDGLKDDNSLFLWWLRSNGRFLLPAGYRDAVNVAASYFRGLLATHLEIGVFSLLLSCLVIFPHLVAFHSGLLTRAGDGLPSPLWLLLPFSGFGMLVLLAAYWFCRDDEDHSQSAYDFCVMCASGGVSSLLVFARTPVWLCLLTSIPAAGYVVHWLAQWIWAKKPADTGGLPGNTARAQQARVRFTAWFGGLITVTFAILALGLLDFLTWVAAQHLSRDGIADYTISIGATATALMALRIVVPILQKKLVSDRLSLPLTSLANIVGLLLTAVLVALWMIATQWYVFGQFDEDSFTEILQPTDRWIALTSMVVLYVVLTWRNNQQVNRSSLHPFYRSRIARAYVATGNSPDHDVAESNRRFQVSPLQKAERSSTEFVGKINEFWDGDDCRMRDYVPHRYGGPIHLVGCCINQTVDDRTANYNADRKGVSLTVSSLGLEIGTRRPYDDGEILSSGLAQWIAVSGAAIGPGMGSASRYGISALSFLTGTRLGFWWHRAANEFAVTPSKYGSTLREWLGQFPGLNSSPLYLSDGGHFDNTGVYPLLKRKPELIVLADCGADPRYLFGDVENLIRKSRIDYNARIEFLSIEKPHLDPSLHDLVALFGTPDSITSAVGRQFLLLARISYDSGERGLLLVVKPRRVDNLTVDIAGYSDRDRVFPQQGTNDQFFDESQWDSYSELGGVLGGLINERLVAALPLLATAGTVAVSNLDSDDGVTESNGGSRRERYLTIGKTLGIGALFTVAITGWQLWREARSDQWKAITERTESINGLTSPADKGGRVARILAGQSYDWKSELSDLIAAIETIGLLHGRHAQETARTQFAQALHRACDAQANDAVLPRANCSQALAALAVARPPFWSRNVEAYWNSSGRRGLGATCASSSTPSHVVIHNGRQGDNAGMKDLEDQIRRNQLLARRTDSFAADIPLKLAESFVQFDKPTLVGTEADWLCTKRIAKSLSYRGTNVEAEAWPGFSYGSGELHLWLPQAVNAAIQGETAYPPSVAVGTSSSSTKRYRVYIRFQGSVAREQIDSVRNHLAQQQEKSPYAFEVPRAERIAGPYTDQVNYFSDEDRDAAKYLLERTKTAIEDSGCPASTFNVEPKKAVGTPPPHTLEVWLAARKCNG